MTREVFVNGVPAKASGLLILLGLATGCGMPAATPHHQRSRAASASPAAQASLNGPTLARMQWTGPAHPQDTSALLGGVPDRGVVETEGNRVRVGHAGSWTDFSFPPTILAGRAVFTTAADGMVYVQDMTNAGTSFRAYRTTNGGQTWSLQATGLGAPGEGQRVVRYGGTFYAVNSPGQVTVLPGEGAVLMSRGGIHWTAVPGLPPNFTATGLAEGPGGTLVIAGAVGAAGEILQGHPGSFRVVLKAPEPLADVAVQGLFGLAVGGSPPIPGVSGDTAGQVVYASADGGAQWRQLESATHTASNLSRVFLTPGGTAYALAGEVAAGANGPGYLALYRSTDGGKSFVPVLKGQLAGAFAVSSSVIYAATRNGPLWESTDAGASWTLAGSGTLPVDWATFLSPTVGYAAVNTGLGEVLVKTEDGGRSWVFLRNLGPDFPIAWFTPRSGVVVTAGARLANISSSTLTAMSGPGRDGPGVAAAVFISPSDGYAVTAVEKGPAAPTLYGTRDAGRSWQALPSPLHNLFGLTALGRDVAGTSGNQWEWSSDQGRVWRTGTLGKTASPGPAALNPDGNLWLVGFGGPRMTPTVWVVHPDGRFRRYPAPTLINQLGFASRLFGFMVSATGTLYVTDNGGQVWTATAITMRHALLWSMSAGIGATAR